VFKIDKRYNHITPGGFSLVVANSYDFFLLGTDAPVIVFEIFIGRRILPTLSFAFGF
jgi:hypothetical protein